MTPNTTRVVIDAITESGIYTPVVREITMTYRTFADGNGQWIKQIKLYLAHNGAPVERDAEGNFIVVGTGEKLLAG